MFLFSIFHFPQAQRQRSTSTVPLLNKISVNAGDISSEVEYGRRMRKRHKLNGKGLVEYLHLAV